MIDVTCAIIRNEEEEILVVQRGGATDHPLKWEFPGGKIEGGETDEGCIIREIREELSMDIVICGRLQVVEYDYGHKKIRLIPFVCDTLSDIPFLSEHEAYRWVEVKELKSVDFSEADIFVASDYVECFGKKVPLNENEEKSTAKIPDDSELKAMIDRMISLKELDWIAASAKDNPGILQKLFDFSYSSDKKMSFYASWILSKVCDKFPEIIYPYIPLMTESLINIDNESVLRSFLRIISLNDPGKLSAKHHGILADHCFNHLYSHNSAIAVKVYAMEILFRLTFIYPDLATELLASLKSSSDVKSAALTSRSNAIIKKLTGNKSSPEQKRT